ncbi:MAG: hypothetical protein H7235_02430 [Bdellovibrionaceae bacterium]|nr:hypothetical protein [Pseudobdellovibrionaceae bacterium]
MAEVDKKPKSSGSRVLAQEKAREQYKQNLWNYRVILIKKGNLLVKNHLYGEAAVIYEKYLKILEIIYDCGPNGLTPEMLKESARTTELSILAGVYWDLVRIYDTNDACLERQKKSAEKLARFAAFTPLFIDLMRKAKIFQKTSRHPDVIRNMIAKAGTVKTRCFIATAAFESPAAPEVLALREFRDMNLRETQWGRQIIYYYYKYSPRVACYIDEHEYLKAPIRFGLRVLIKCVTAIYK